MDEALERANATPFGLCASIWTADDAVADDMVGRLQAGTVFVNAHGTSAMDHRAPFGGWKQSGYGVELGPEGHAGLHPTPHGPALPAHVTDSTDAPFCLEAPCSTF